MFLARLTLKRSPDVAALGALPDPAHEGRRIDAQHRLISTGLSGQPLLVTQPDGAIFSGATWGRGVPGAFPSPARRKRALRAVRGETLRP